MKKIVLISIAFVAAILGILSVIAGTRVLTGAFVPGYTVLKPLVIYNVVVGAMSIAAGFLIWKKHKTAVLLSGLITILHILVLISLLTVFNDLAARQSVMAMTFRAVVWVGIFAVVKTNEGAA
ncbi:MAG TPA: hypothetical protein ENK44_10275 [Caldithrix abyssi]|uniref:DUF4345 domain-containing protein n=1 Tax=Caldithrix abyssi TaxID=187145 RepID=A0A7V4U135_CALAY|nr:hypothetical protein [Caldithrix abyssi]